MSDPKVYLIIRFESNESIRGAISRNKKLMNIPKDLYLQEEKQSKSSNRENPCINSIQDAFAYVPQTFGYWNKWGGKWRKQF